jgi:hypothetical protein
MHPSAGPRADTAPRDSGFPFAAGDAGHGPMSEELTGIETVDLRD